MKGICLNTRIHHIRPFAQRGGNGIFPRLDQTPYRRVRRSRNEVEYAHGSTQCCHRREKMIRPQVAALSKFMITAAWFVGASMTIAQAPSAPQPTPGRRARCIRRVPRRPRAIPTRPVMYWPKICLTEQMRPQIQTETLSSAPRTTPAPEASVQDGVPQGTVVEFTMDSADSKIYPGIARDAGTFGTPDPADPSKLILTTSHPAHYTRHVAVYVPSNMSLEQPRLSSLGRTARTGSCSRSWTI
jgi:hypothetical protein